MTDPDRTTERPTNGFGVAALVLGIVAVVTALNGWWLFVLPIAIATGILAVVFGRRGRRMADAGEATNRGQATAGLVLGTTALGLVLAATVAFAAFGGNWDGEHWGDDTFSECVDDADNTPELIECIQEFPQEASEAGLSFDG